MMGRLNTIAVIGENIRKRREHYRLSLEEAADGLQMPADLLSMYECGKIAPNFNDLYFRLSKFYNVPMYYFFDPSADPDTPHFSEIAGIVDSLPQEIPRKPLIETIEKAGRHMIHLNEVIPSGSLMTISESCLLTALFRYEKECGLSLRTASECCDRKRFNCLRETLYDYGIYVIGDPFKNLPWRVTGIVLYDDLYPVIFYNTKNDFLTQASVILSGICSIINRRHSIFILSKDPDTKVPWFYDGNFYHVIVERLGRKYLKDAFEAYSFGRLSIEQLTGVVGCRAPHLHLISSVVHKEE